jgi:uncharacterized protein YndB with AHSA1/START domain
MTDTQRYTPGPAAGATIEKQGGQWTLILTRQLRHPPEKVWLALTDAEQLREWAPYDADGDLGQVGATVTLTWTGTQQSTQTRVIRADRPRLLEYADMRWELTPTGGGTRLVLWHRIDRGYIAWGAAGWHICFDVLAHWLNGDPIGRLAGPSAMQHAGWKQLKAEYEKEFGMEE